MTLVIIIHTVKESPTDKWGNLYEFAGILEFIDLPQHFGTTFINDNVDIYQRKVNVSNVLPHKILTHFSLNGEVKE